MKTNDFKEMYPDVSKQTLECKTRLSRKEVEKRAIGVCNYLQTGLLGFETQENIIYVFTSEKYLEMLNKMTADAKVIDLNGNKGLITSESPFMCGGEMCIRVSYGGEIDVYRCTFFLRIEK